MTNILQKDKGLISIHQTCVNMNAIWRPTTTHDLGIDGQIEFLEPNSCISTGIIIGVQSKSGPSFFERQDDNFVKFYPKEIHKKYWSKVTIPVILVLHNPDSNLTLFTNIKPQLSNNGPILVNKSKIFDSTARDLLIDTALSEQPAESPGMILDRFLTIKLHRDNDIVLTGIDFLLACTNRVGRYFEIRMQRVVALYHLSSESDGFSISNSDYDFIFRNVLLILSKKLSHDFFEEFDEVWHELGCVPDILSPFSKTGDDVIDYLWTNLDKYLSNASYQQISTSSIQELAQHISDYAQRLSDKLDASDRMSMVPK